MRLVTSDADAVPVVAIGATLPSAFVTEVPHPITSTNLIAVTREGVAALGEDDAALGLRPTGADSVHAQYDRIIGASAEKLPKVADHLDAARPDLLACSPHSRADLDEQSAGGPP